jgi:hypothetical protein
MMLSDFALVPNWALIVLSGCILFLVAVIFAVLRINSQMSRWEEELENTGERK